ncbi:TPA: hypothetical protein ACH3X2_012073 [Trebouxia sp. C0005]
MEPGAVQAGTCGSMAHEQKQYLRFDAHHSPTASVAASSPPLAASHHTPHHQALRTPPLIQSAESLGRGPFIRFNFVNGCALGFCTTWSEVEEATVGPGRDFLHQHAFNYFADEQHSSLM